ncbi:MAG: hypothetical protein ACFFD4_29680 [Candidatus Odinarchaeota archaeon]
MIDENLHVYRDKKSSKEQRSIRKQRYQYGPKDHVRYQGNPYMVKGVQNYGQHVKLDGLSKPVKTALVNPARWRKGVCTVT